MKHKVSELEGALLDAAVAKAEGHDGYVLSEAGGASFRAFQPSSLWEDGGPIIEREPFGIFEKDGEQWRAGLYRDGVCVAYESGPTILIAAMRAYVASRFGEEVELP